MNVIYITYLRRSHATVISAIFSRTCSVSGIDPEENIERNGTKVPWLSIESN